MIFEIAKKSIKTDPGNPRCYTYTQLKGWPILKGLHYRKDFSNNSAILLYNEKSCKIASTEDIRQALTEFARILIDDFIKEYKKTDLHSPIVNDIKSSYRYS